MVTELELAYLAGLLDGEGSLQFRYVKKCKRYYPRVVIKMNSGNWEELINQINLGNIYQNIGKYKEQTAWYLYKMSDICDFLIVLLPYLRVKRKKAEVMVNWIRKGDTSQLPLEW